MRSFLVLVLISFISSQNLKTPRVSPAAEVRQTIGFSEIIINYSRPLVKDRSIYGTTLAHKGLVASQFGLQTPAPWRAGANENTTFSITDDAVINGKHLPAGKYGLFMQISDNKWTIIFNKDADAWGNFFYIKENDVLRIDVSPTSVAHREALLYYADDITGNSTTIYMEWEKKQVSFKVEFDQVAVTLANFRKQLTNVAGFGNGWIQAATYCFNNNMNHDEAIRWVDQSLKINGRRFNDISVKAGLLAQKGDNKTSDNLMKAAIVNASEADINVYGYNLLAQKRYEEAIQQFKNNNEKYPNSWNTYDSLADAYGQSGNKSESIRLFKKALSLAPDAQKQRIQTLISNLEN